MGYRKAETILPSEVVALIQQYVDGEYIYIPRREGKRKSWGETTGCRKETSERNRRIYRDYRSGLLKLFFCHVFKAVNENDLCYTDNKELSVGRRQSD